MLKRGDVTRSYVISGGGTRGQVDFQIEVITTCGTLKYSPSQNVVRHWIGGRFKKSEPYVYVCIRTMDERKWGIYNYVT